MLADKPLLPIKQEAESVNTNSICRQVLNSLQASEEYRHAFVEECIRSRLTTQIRTMREHQAVPWDYKTFADKLGKKVSWTYRLEDPNASTPTIPTLLEVAKAFDVALDVRFVPFSRLLHDTTTLTTDSFGVPSFNNELPELEHLADAESTATQTPETLHLFQEAAYLGTNPLDQFATAMAPEWLQAWHQSFASGGSGSLGGALFDYVQADMKPPIDIGWYRSTKKAPGSETVTEDLYNAQPKRERA